MEMIKCPACGSSRYRTFGPETLCTHCGYTHKKEVNAKLIQYGGQNENNNNSD